MPANIEGFDTFVILESIFFLILLIGFIVQCFILYYLNKEHNRIQKELEELREKSNKMIDDLIHDIQDAHAIIEKLRSTK